MNRKILETLEYSKIKREVARYLTTTMGRDALDRLEPVSNPQLIQRWLDETDDGFHLYRIKDGIPVPKLFNVTEYLKRLQIYDTLNGIELARIMKILVSTAWVINFFKTLENDGVQLNPQ